VRPEGLAIPTPFSNRQHLVERPPECFRVDGRIAKQVRFDVGERFPERIGTDQAARQQLADVRDVLCVAALDLGQRLRGQVVVMKAEAAFLRDERTALGPSLRYRDENWSGAASSTLTRNDSFSLGMARRTRS
jgi:hypothetical protein